jgi:hypothetical protein
MIGTSYNSVVHCALVVVIPVDKVFWFVLLVMLAVHLLPPPNCSNMNGNQNTGDDNGTDNGNDNSDVVIG